jgi:hypothetical protein
MAHDVFISYSSKDKPVADAVCAGLEGRGIRCWAAPRDILPGMDWGAAIIDAITGAKVMVLIFSGNANASQQIKREVERAVAKSVKILPFRIEDVPMSKSLEYFISTPHWLDALTQPLEGHIARLADTVRLLVARDSRQGPPEPIPRQPAPWPPGAPPRDLPPLVQPYRPGKRGVIAVAVAVAALAVLAPIVLRRKLPPEIVAVNFPPSIGATGRDVAGTVQFKAGNDPIAQAQFDVVAAESFDPFTIQTRGVAAQKEGSLSFAIHSSIPQQVTLKATLIDAKGRRSNPMSFSFEARKAAAAQKKRDVEIQMPPFKFKIPH